MTAFHARRNAAGAGLRFSDMDRLTGRDMGVFARARPELPAAGWSGRRT